MNPETSFEPEMVGCKEASVFPGFCNYHDTTTFKPIDDRDFTGEPQQVFLLAYRALCRELLLVQSKDTIFPKFFELLRGRKGSELEDGIRAFTKDQLLNNHDLQQFQPEKARYDSMLLNGDFRKLNYYIIWLRRTPDVLCSMFVPPFSDFSGNVVQKLPSLSAPWQTCAVSFVALDSGGAAVFSWDPKAAPTMQRFIQSLHAIADIRLTDALIRFAFEYSNNICLAPSWWQRLQPHVKSVLVSRFESTIFKGRHRNGLKDDGNQFANWLPSTRHTNASL